MAEDGAGEQKDQPCDQSVGTLGHVITAQSPDLVCGGWLVAGNEVQSCGR